MKIKLLAIKQIYVFVFSFIAVFSIPYYFLAGGTLIGFLIVRLIGHFSVQMAMIGYHRWAAHMSFIPSMMGKFLMCISMVLSGQGRPLRSVLTHRAHHTYSDTENDPLYFKDKSMLQLIFGQVNSKYPKTVPRDFFKIKSLKVLNQYYWWFWLVAFVGMALIDLKTALIFMPINFVMVVTTNVIVNYIGHHREDGSIGPSNVKMPMGLVYFLTMGEELHLNHHLAPKRFDFGDDKNVDISAAFIKRILMK